MLDDICDPVSPWSTRSTRKNSMDSLNSRDSSRESISCESGGKDVATWNGRLGTLTYADGSFVWSTQTTTLNGKVVMEDKKPIWIPDVFTRLTADEINSRRGDFMTIYYGLSLAEQHQLDLNAYTLSEGLDQNAFEPHGRSIQAGLLRTDLNSHLQQLG